uniref:Uncharacterized protein n=1 Tax=Romanomermis culicivorax TaxID=13658 RepID=A0A915I3D2_ROMCU
TTRLPKPGEIDGVDYRFVTKEDFDALERHGELLESGVFEGNFYGTPRPPRLEEQELDQEQQQLQSIISNFDRLDDVSNISLEEPRALIQIGRTAMPSVYLNEQTPAPRANVSVPLPLNGYNNNAQNGYSNGFNASFEQTGHKNLSNGNGFSLNKNSDENKAAENGRDDDELGPLPTNWEIAYTDAGEKYFIDHNTSTTHWNDPRIKSTDSTSSEELPFGWAKVYDANYGVFYVDHINKKTQYEKPSMDTYEVAFNIMHGGGNGMKLHFGGSGYSSRPKPQQQRHQRYSSSSTISQQKKYGSIPDLSVTSESPIINNVEIAPKAKNQSKNFFTRDPAELKGELISARLVKSAKGLGFTLVGNDGSSAEEEMLQIKNIIPGGPAYKDGNLKTGDVLVHVNETCVLGYTQDDIIRLFQLIPAGISVNLQICRGYPLFFDPNDPTNDFVMQDAYSSNGFSPPAAPVPPADLLPPEIITVHIEKGDSGFGFTITDCPYGQKIKCIIDQERCATLRQGDILVGINGYNVRKMSHADVVDRLKNCEAGQVATIVCQRYKMSTLQRNGVSELAKKPPPSVPPKPYNSRSNVHNDVGRPHSYHPGFGVNRKILSNKMCAFLGSLDESTLQRDLNRMQISNSNGSTPWHHQPLNGQPTLMPRSQTNFNNNTLAANAAPPRPVKTNGYASVAYSNGRMVENDASTAHYFAPIYENLPEKGKKSENSNKNGTAKNVEAGFFASATPNYVPISVYTSGKLASSSGTVNRSNNVESDLQQPVSSSSGQQQQQRYYSPKEQQSARVYGNGSNNNRNYQYITVNLTRKPDGFGFRIVGGTEEGTQTSVGFVVPGGACDDDGRLKMGDEIVEIDGRSTVGTSHRMAVDLLKQASNVGHVKITVRRETPSYSDIPKSTSMPFQQQTSRKHVDNVDASFHTSNNIQYPYDVNIVRRQKEGFGFVIISSANSKGSVVGKIIENSPAARCGRLFVGDFIVAVNGVDILCMPHGDIVNLIKDSGYTVTLTVGFHEDIPAEIINQNLSACSSSSYRNSPSALLNDSSYCSQRQNTSTAYDRPLSIVSLVNILKGLSPPPSDYGAIDVSEPPSPPRSRCDVSDADFNCINCTNFNCFHEYQTSPAGNGGNTDEFFTAELLRGNKGFGFSIRGGREYSNMDLFVLKIAEGGPADLDGRLQVLKTLRLNFKYDRLNSDQIMEINGISTKGMTHAEALELLRRDSNVRLLLLRRRRQQDPQYSGVGAKASSFVMLQSTSVGQYYDHEREQNFQGILPQERLNRDEIIWVRRASAKRQTPTAARSSLYCASSRDFEILALNNGFCRPKRVYFANWSPEPPSNEPNYGIVSNGSPYKNDQSTSSMNDRNTANSLWSRNIGSNDFYHFGPEHILIDY